MTLVFVSIGAIAVKLVMVGGAIWAVCDEVEAQNSGRRDRKRVEPRRRINFAELTTEKYDEVKAEADSLRTKALIFIRASKWTDFEDVSISLNELSDDVRAFDQSLSEDINNQSRELVAEYLRKRGMLVSVVGRVH
jgi:hypothetical protein